MDSTAAQKLRSLLVQAHDAVTAAIMAVDTALGAAGSAVAAVLPPVPAGFIYMNATGHVLPLAKPEHYSLWGYYMAASVLAGGFAGQNGPGFSSEAAQAYRDAGKDPENRDNWPEVVDRYLNIDAYDPAGKEARAAAKAAIPKDPWIAHDPRVTPGDDTVEVGQG